ncbi:MAG: B12-binding domain-containing radical SAM protein [Syntrophales bacterium]
MRLLLVQPLYPLSFFSYSFHHPLLRKFTKKYMAPHELAVLAALTPESWEIKILDEGVREIKWSLDSDFDCVGITGMSHQKERIFYLLSEFKKRNPKIRTVLGGPAVSSDPQAFAGKADVIFIGDAERTWPLFCMDLEAGKTDSMYRDSGFPPLELMPLPRWDLVSAQDYAYFPIQTQRGCPFDCEFCDVTARNGKEVRTKPIAKVLDEWNRLREIKADGIIFVDDNFYGRPAYTQELVTALVEESRKHSWIPASITQASLNIGEKKDLLFKMRECGFHFLFLGIETPSLEALREAGKTINLTGSLSERIRNIQRAGIIPFAGMITGFDSDDLSIFDRQFQFIQEESIPFVLSSTLTAFPNTRLHHRMKVEGRLLDNKDANLDWGSNFVTKNFTEKEHLIHHNELRKKIYDPENYVLRTLRSLSYAERKFPRFRFSNSSLGFALKVFTWKELWELGKMLRPVLRAAWKHRNLFLKAPNKEMALRSILSWPYSHLFLQYVERELQNRYPSESLSLAPSLAPSRAAANPPS